MRKATDVEAQSYLTYFHRPVLASCAVVKTDPYERGLYVRSWDRETVTQGFMPYDANQDPLLFEEDGSGIDVTAYGRTLLVAFEKRIMVQTEGEEPERLFEEPDEELFLRVNVIEHDNRACLAVLSSSEGHDPPLGRVAF